MRGEELRLGDKVLVEGYMRRKDGVRLYEPCITEWSFKHDALVFEERAGSGHFVISANAESNKFIIVDEEHWKLTPEDELPS